ncbi:hypothetical protein C1H46_017458 [Malus baccata]|uniref:Uncharacterized protein n=1 Tax=Malus baccata TaxID=106549 RepID=A0A540MER5_MALBA|nr:hypothetical protein C1H46_017458 [Malus baccata]
MHSLTLLIFLLEEYHYGRKEEANPYRLSSEASIDNRQIKVAAIITSNSKVDAVITSGSTQGSVNGLCTTKCEAMEECRKKEVDKMIERITSKYNIDMSLPHVSTYIKNALQMRFVDFRHKLKKYFDSYPILEEAQHNKNENVTSQEEWKFLCDHYASVQFKECSDKNTINRSHLTYNHKAGSKSFRVHEYEIEEMIGMKNDTTLPDEVPGHKFGYFKGPSKFLSFEDSVLSKHLEERAETQQQELVTTKQKLVETKEELGEAKQEIQELRENQKKFEELFHKIMEGQQPPP